jgi:hypothetical protein
MLPVDVFAQDELAASRTFNGCDGMETKIQLAGRRWWSSSMVLLGFGKLGDDGDTLQLLACKFNGLESRLFVLELGVLRNWHWVNVRTY